MSSGRKRPSEATHGSAKALHKAPPRLVLHFDINETIMLGDPAGGDSYEDTLHKVLAKVAFVRPNPAAGTAGGRWSEYVWHDGTPLDPLYREAGTQPPPLLFDWEPPEDATPFYKVRALKQPFAKCFAAPGSPGVIYAAELERLRDALRWPEGTPADPRLSTGGYYTFLPAFFHTLSELATGERDFSIVLRTFGTDLPHVAAAVTAFADGAHPLWKGQTFPSLRLQARELWSGRYGAETGAFTLRRPHTEERTTGSVSAATAAAAAALEAADGGAPIEPRTLVTDLEVEAELRGGGGGSSSGGGCADSSGALADTLAVTEGAVTGALVPRGSICGVTDHYEWWRERSYVPSAGKPLFWTLDDQTTHTLFFDDNIHNDAHDSIVAVRARRDAGAPFRPLSGEVTRRLHGWLLRKVHTIKPILERGWFLEQVAASEAMMAEMRRAEADGADEVGGLLAEVRAMLPQA